MDEAAWLRKQRQASPVRQRTAAKEGRQKEPTMKHKKHTGHHHEIAKANGHMADPAPKGNKAFASGIYATGIKGDKMAHGTHHAANAHHGMGEGMGPMEEHGTVSTKGSHLGNNETHENDYASSEGSGGGEGDIGGEDHGGGESSEG
jgi:hypothetical protein